MQKPVVCNGTEGITYIDGSVVRINRTALRLFYQDELDHCEYQSIQRADGDNTYTYSPTITSFTNDTQLSHEFIRVACYGKTGGMLATNFHALILEKNDVEDRSEKNYFKNKVTKKEQFNIVAIGVDSISRLNFIRHLPKTRDFLLRELQAVELQGYNKVADNTYVNLVPMFAGKYVEELPWDETMSYKPFDEFNFIWQNFSDSGYRTLYAEDAPTIAIFNYAKEGFHKAPADYYLRPWSLALEDHGSIWRNGRDCVGNQLETNLVLDYVKRFLYKFRAKPHFAFSFITRLTHDNINKAGLADEPYFTFFKEIKRQGLINNTVILFYSDHGMRFGDIRGTYVGKLEERLPFLYLTFPDWFAEKYPEHMKNLKLNSNRLTSPFDIYETLRDILHFDGAIRRQDVTKRGHSLFSPIPQERTCDHAAILPHWCTCHQQKTVSLNDEDIKQAAQDVVRHINRATEVSSGLCAQLRLDQILDARSILVNEKILRFQASLHDVLGRKVNYGARTEAMVTYLLTVRAQPGGGIFEATVGRSEKRSEFRIFGEISRINRYGNQGSCIKSHSLRKFCYC